MVLCDASIRLAVVFCDVDGFSVVTLVRFSKFSSVLAVYLLVFMASVLSGTEFVHRNSLCNSKSYQKSIINSLVRISFNKISRENQAELFSLKKEIHSISYHTCLLPLNFYCGGRFFIPKLFVVCSLY